MIKIEITGDTAREVAASVHGLFQAFNLNAEPNTGEAGTTSDKVVTNTARATDKPGSRGRGKVAEEKQGIQTGEERKDPADSAADQKQDAKDEANDTAAQQPKPIVLTHDSVRSLLGGYVQAYGMAAAQEDGPKLIGIAKISEIPDDQKALAKAVIAIATGIEKNPHKRAMEGDGLDADKIAEMKPIVQHAQKVIA